MSLALRKCCVAFTAFFAVALTASHAATFVVTNIADSGTGTLREAIGLANINGADDIITFSPSLAGGTITLTAGELQIDEFATALTITAGGLPGGVTISGGRATRVFAIFSGPTVTLDSLIVADGQDDFGGGILSEGNLTLKRCLITRNVARHGSAGGLYQYAGFLTIEETTFAENVCVGDSEASGAGAYLLSSSADIVNSTFSGNCAVAALGTAQGGALFQTGGGISIRHCTFTRNRARGLSSYGGALVMGGLADASHTIFAGNEALFGPEIYSGVAVVTSSGHNFLGIGTNVLGFTNGVNGDRAGTAGSPLDAGLGPLQFNGGFAPTHAPLACSPVIDAAPDSGSSPDTDQRGLRRLVDGNGSGTPRLDLGAVEAGPAVFVTARTDDSDGLHLGGTSLREALANAKIPGTRILFDTAVFAQPQIDLDPLKGPLVVRSENLAIDASALSSQLIISGQNAIRAFDVPAEATLSLTRIRLTGGKAGTGGGLRIAAGASVNLDRCAIVSCLASNGGGAIANAGRLILNDCQLLQNTTTRGAGGALDNAPASSADIFNSIISDNTASAGNGGGIHNGPGARLLLSQSAVQHNAASGGGGGIYSGGTNSPAQASLRYSTIVHNSTGVSGGGVANMNILRSTHTMIACNRRGSLPDDCAGAVTSDGYNLVGTTTGATGFTGPGDVRNVEAPLRAFNTPTGILYSPELDSPAVDAGFNTKSPNPDNLIFCGSLPSQDLTGLGRVVNALGGTTLRVDIGAVEFQRQHSFATNAVPWPVPGRIEAENFDAGGEGVAYSDTSPLNLAGAYRPDEGVDIEAALDDGGGFDVTATVSGEWLKYTVEVQSSGRYTLLLRVAMDAPSGTVRVDIDGVDKTGSITLPDTGGDQDWTTISRTGIELTAGRHVMRVAWGAGTANLNYIEWRAEAEERGLTRLLYLNRGGALISDFYAGPRGQGIVPPNPEPFGTGATESGRVSSFEAPTDLADDYGVVLAGYIAPSQSGYYSFYLCANNEGELWMSSDENPIHSSLIAVEPEGNASRTWVNGVGRPALNGRPANVSAPIFMEACRRYYVEAIMKEGDGADNLAVAWQRAGEPAPVNGGLPIGSAWLRPLLDREPVIAPGNPYVVGVPRITPSFQSINPEQPAASCEFRVTAGVVGPVSYEWLLNGQPVAGTNFSGMDSAVLKIMSPAPAQAGLYTVVLRGPSNTNISAPAVLGVQDTVSPDTNAPVLAVSAPAVASVTATNAIFTLRGTATDNRGVLAVFVSGDGFTNRLASGTTNWSFATALNAGTNRFFIRAVDFAGNTSAFVTRTIVLPNTNRLGLVIVGQGTVAPSLTNAPLVAGRTYKITATPRPGFVFAGWSGDAVSSSNVLNFRLTPGLVLQANFVANPFAIRKGVYAGLFYQTNEVRHENSGFITATVTEAGAFSGRLTLAGKPVPFSGRFAPGGITQLRLARRGTTPLTLELRLSADDDAQLIGGLTDGSWVAEVLADRAVFNATNRAPFAGRHTLIIPGTANPGSPGGDSFGAASVSASGKVVFSGMLADGTAASQSAPVARGGEWPFYAALYTGKGSVIGWLTFSTNSPTESLGGLVSWSKPASFAAAIYPGGFASESLATGSSYRPPTTNRVLNFSNGVVQFTGGNIHYTPAFNVGLTAGNKIVHTNGAAFSMSLTPVNGLFSGSFVPPGTNTVLRFRGALLQPTESGTGFFLNRNVSGKVGFEAAR